MQALRADRRRALDKAARVREFLSHASHEIRTPLHGVVGYASLLLGTQLTDEQRALADALRAGVDSLLGVVNDVLDLSRLDGGAMRLEAQEFDVVSLVDGVARQFGAEAWTKGLELQVETGGVACAALLGDPGRIRQVLGNLVANAVKFTDAGMVRVEVSSRTLRRTGKGDGPNPCELRISVADSGPGIPRHARRRLFHPFSRLTPAGGSRKPGAGLGLAISRQLVELMGGRLKFNAGADGGSVFSFVIRAGEAAASFAGERRDLDAERLRVYVADDDAVSRRDLLMALLAERIGVAGSGPVTGLLDALRAADAAGRLPDLVVVGQVQEPDRDLAVAAALAHESRIARVPLVLAPVSGMRGHAHAVRQAGYSAYLPRPFHSGELHRCLRAVLRGVGSSSDVVAGHTGPTGTGTHLITRHRLADEQRMASAGRVLIADDDPANLKVTRLQVERLGYPVDVVENGAEAVAAASRSDYQIVLMDCQMPKMNGLVATTEIRRRGDGRGPVIVAVTAETGEEWRQRCLLAGMNDVLEKPVRTHVLAEVLNRYARTRTTTPGDRPGFGGPARGAHDRLDEARTASAGDASPAGDGEARHVGGIDDLIADVGIELTLELAREYVTGVTRALETVAIGDLAAIRHDAHRLLGSARTLSLATFERLWRRVEDLASLPEEIPAATIDELRRARVELERWIERHHEKHCA
jgi:CheY-like chemotaxis protein/nitrogen-specific signal transduction histidine kinase